MFIDGRIHDIISFKTVKIFNRFKFGLLQLKEYCIVDFGYIGRALHFGSLG